MKIILAGLARFGERYAGLAREMASEEKEPKRKAELETIAEVCRRVPRLGARTFHEALQSLFFAQIAVNLESLDNGICPGRIDQYLYPYYRTSLKDPSFSPRQAKELLAAFSIKMAEIIPVFSKPMMRFHGGMFNGQVVTVGGVDESGNDAANELSDLLLEIMDELRMRQPNFHARVHRSSPEAYRHKINRALASGSGSPALYNDEVIIEALCRHGYQDGRCEKLHRRRMRGTRLPGEELLFHRCGPLQRPHHAGAGPQRGAALRFLFPERPEDQTGQPG